MAIVQLLSRSEFLEDFLPLIVRPVFIGCGCGYRLRFAAAVGADLVFRSSLADGRSICFPPAVDYLELVKLGRASCSVRASLPLARGPFLGVLAMSSNPSQVVAPVVLGPGMSAVEAVQYLREGRTDLEALRAWAMSTVLRARASDGDLPPRLSHRGSSLALRRE